MVQDVVSLGAELKPLRFGHEDVLYQRHVEIPETHGSQTADGGAAETVARPYQWRCRTDEARRVVPLADGLMVWNQRAPAQQAGAAVTGDRAARVREVRWVIAVRR